MHAQMQWCTMPMQVHVSLEPRYLHIQCGDRIILSGPLYNDIKEEDSTWTMEDGILHVHMLKRNRRGNYANKCTNADTFWYAVTRTAASPEQLQLEYPPAAYYNSFFELPHAAARMPRLTSSRRVNA